MAKSKISIQVGRDTQNIIVGNNNTIVTNNKNDAPPLLFLVPFPHNPDFVGRETELTALHEMLQQGQSIVGIRPTVLVGLGGIGKTQLAVEYAHAQRAAYPGGVFWLNAVNSLLLEFADLAEKLELAERETPRDKAARKAWDYLDAHPETLVIFDNVVEPADLNVPFSPDLVPANLRCRTLFTTRQRDFPRTFQPFEVKVLPEMAAMRLLLHARPEVLEEYHPEWGWARIVCASLGWLPLALELAAAYLGAYPEVTMTGYLERLRSEGSLETVDDTELRPQDLPTRHDIAVTATLQTQWNRLEDKDAQLLFRAAGQFSEASWISMPRLGLLIGIESEGRPGHPAPLVRVLKKLHAVSLIEELTNDRLRLHPLVQTFAAQLSPPAFRLELAARVAALDDVPRLQARMVRYGIDMVLEDIRTGLGFCMSEPKSETYPRLSILERVLDRQTHHLRGWDVQSQPAFFLQQLRNESFDHDLSELQARAEAQLAQLGKPYLSERFKVSRDSAELVRTFGGHNDWVSGVALSADGRLAISASRDKMLKVWDVQTGRELRTLSGHSESVLGVALSADTRLAISASRDKTLKVWDVQTGRELRTLNGHSNVVCSVAFSADGSLAISASFDKTLKVWNVQTGQELHTLNGHSDTVLGVALSADRRLAVSASYDNTLKVWDVQTGQELRTLSGHSESVQGVALSADGRLVVSASADNTLKVWDVQTGRELRTLSGHSESVQGVALSTDGRLVISASADNTLKVWDVQTGQELRTLSGHGESVRDVALSANGRLVVSASNDNTLKVWDVERRRELRGLSGHSESVRGVALSTDGRLAVSASYDKTLKTWGVQMGQELHTLNGHSDTVLGVALSADRRLAVSASYDKTLKVWDVQTGRELRTLSGHSESVQGVALSADGRLVVSASADNTLKVWDVQTGQELHTLSGHSESVQGVALSADGRLAVSASYDNTLKVWDVQTGQELRMLSGHSKSVQGVALSADGRLVVSASADNTLKVWDVQTGWELRTLSGHTESVYDVALSANGQLVVSASYDKILKVWDVQTGQVMAMLPTSAPLCCCAITPDEKTIVAGDEIGMMHFLEWVGEIKGTKTSQDLKWMTDTVLDWGWIDKIKETETIQDEKVETHSSRWPHWLKGLLRW